MSISNSNKFDVDSQRIDHNIRHYLQVFENEMVRRIQESEDRIRAEIKHASLYKMDQIINLVSQVQVRHFEATDQYKKQSELVEQINGELKALRVELGKKPVVLQQSPMNSMIKENWREQQSPCLKRPRISESESPGNENSITQTTMMNSDCPTRFITSDPRTNEAAYKIQMSTRYRCIYCQYGHFSDECPIVSDACERKEILRNQNRCFRCCGRLDNHVSCNSKECRYCKMIGKQRIDHHSSICRVPLNYYYSPE